jgi:hypothetical protein
MKKKPKNIHHVQNPENQKLELQTPMFNLFWIQTHKFITTAGFYKFSQFFSKFKPLKSFLKFTIIGLYILAQIPQFIFSFLFLPYIKPKKLS